MYETHEEYNLIDHQHLKMGWLNMQKSLIKHTEYNLIDHQHLKIGMVEYAKIIARVGARESFCQISFFYAIVGNFQQFLN